MKQYFHALLHSLYLSSSLAYPVNDLEDRDDGNLTAAALFARAVSDGKYTSYTAVGDSYAAGVGAGEASKFDKEVGGVCHRNDGAYAFLYYEANKNPDGSDGLQLQFNACNGAQAGGVKDIQITGPDARFEKPDLVTVQAGGNDGSSFIDLCVSCAILRNSDGNCQSNIDKAKKTWGDLVPLLTDLYFEAATHGRNAADLAIDKRTVSALGYPRLYNENSDQSNCPSKDTMQEINKAGRVLSDSMKAAVAEANKRYKTWGAKTKIVYVDVDGYFEGHRLCDGLTNTYIHGGPSPTARNDEVGMYFFHANIAEHKKYFEAIANTLITETVVDRLGGGGP